MLSLANTSFAQAQCLTLCRLLLHRCRQATFVALAAAAAVDATTPLGLALVAGVPTLGIFLVSTLLGLKALLVAPMCVQQQSAHEGCWGCSCTAAIPPLPPSVADCASCWLISLHICC